MLDHDLQGHAATDRDTELSGTTVVKKIITLVPNSTPVLVHSMNVSYSTGMVAALDNAGFSVTRLPMVVMTQDKLAEWLDEVRECWTDRE